jgi:hypothetical protein
MECMQANARQEACIFKSVVHSVSMVPYTLLFSLHSVKYNFNSFISIVPTSTWKNDICN